MNPNIQTYIHTCTHTLSLSLSLSHTHIHTHTFVCGCECVGTLDGVLTILIYGLKAYAWDPTSGLNYKNIMTVNDDCKRCHKLEHLSRAGNTKGVSIIVLLTSCLTGLD